MKKLTDKDYWESIYEVQSESSSRIKLLLRKLASTSFFNFFFRAYYDYLLWDHVFPESIESLHSGQLVIEIGSAPGDFLVRFSKRFGFTPFGIEYTTYGASQNRKAFINNDLNPNNVIEQDFFSDEFIFQNKEKFDLVISRGFIEHFENLDDVIRRHVELIKPGGLLIVLIPNLRGIYWLWTRIFNPEQLKLHNLEIMKLDSFSRLFELDNISSLKCSYFGTFGFWLFTAPKESKFVNFIIRLLLILQLFLNFIFRVFFGKKGFETSMFSPNLIYIGRKNLG